MRLAEREARRLIHNRIEGPHVAQACTESDGEKGLTQTGRDRTLRDDSVQQELGRMES
jgi:hypothetical protein